jgi:hypothetical protein
MSGSVQGFSFEFVPMEDRPSEVVAYVTCVRSATTKFFSLFIAACMWLLSISAFILASSVWFAGGKIEPPTIGLTAALLFALPAIRNTQPGVPSIGITIDVAGFLWNMFLIFSSCISLIWNYILKYEGGKNAPDELSTNKS